MSPPVRRAVEFIYSSADARRVGMRAEETDWLAGRKHRSYVPACVLCVGWRPTIGLTAGPANLPSLPMLLALLYAVLKGPQWITGDGYVDLSCDVHETGW